jgi:hypothetical protein
MKHILSPLILALLASLPCHAQDQGELADRALAWQWHWSAGQLAATLKNKADGTELNLHSECFQLILGDGRTIKASDCKLIGTPEFFG